MRVLPQFRLRSVVIGCRAALRQTTLWTAVFGMLVTPYAPTYATELPEGAVVESGGVSINPISATRLQINQTTQSGVINWRSFSISEDARVDFIQPNSNASTLNRVTGGQVSQIRGQLNANGRVVLVNPAGILFTANAEVNVGALVASTLDISTQDFLSGQETYGGASSNAVINQGKLKANAGGYIAMVAAQVTNAGTIESPSGSVLLAAGQRVRIDMGGPLQIEVEAGALNAHIESGGGIRASDGLVYLTAKAANDLLASAINHTGIIEAAGLTSVGGRVVLEADTVTLAAGASLSATGFTGGGDVLVGGDWQGGNNAARRIFDNPDQLREATTVTMEAGASIDASATDRGDGGTVVLWSDVHDADAVTTANGHISATGGDNGGDGGDIETSGHKLLVDALSVDASAGQGVGGEWLLDPYNISISSAATSGTGDSSASGVQTYAAAGSSSNINAGTITSALGGGTSVTVTTGSSGSDLGDIVVSAAITSAASSDVRLRLQAANSIIVNNAITASGSGKLHIELDADSDNGTRDGGGIVMLSADIATNGGDLTFGGTTSNGATGGDLYVDGGASAITATTNGGAVNINGQLIVSTSHATGFSINSGGGNVNIGGSIDSGNSYTFFSASSGGSWLSAAQDAKNGTNGGSAEGDSYLVSITSKLENSIATYKAGYRGAWIGAYRDPNTTSWYWVGGPEAGGTYAVSGASPLTAVVGANDTSFFTQSSGSNLNTAGQYSNGSLTSSGVFANFGAAEPNGSGTGGENVGQFFGALGLWNDLSKGTSYSTSDSPYAVWGYLRETNAAPSVVNINAGAGSLTLSAATGANKALASLNVTAGGLTASAVNTTAGVNVTTSAASVISGVVSGTGALTKAGTGTLTLSGASTYTGATNVNDGTLKITGSIYSNVNSNPSTAITTVASGATLDLTNWGWAGSLGTRYYESNALVIDGGTLRYSGASDSSATRGFTVTSAGATFDSATAGVTWGLDVSATASYVPVIGGSLRFTGAGHTSFSQAITGTGVTLTKEGAGILTLTGINTYTGNTTVSGGTLQVGSAAALGGGTYSGALSIASGATFDYASTAAQLLMGTVSGAGAVLKSGAGTLSLLGNNTFSGGLTLSAGTLGVYTNTGAGTGDITLGEGTSMLLGRAVTSIANDITLAGNATIGLDTLVEYLVVGGGGGGGAHVGGGGGGGGVLHSSANLVDSSYSVVVGDGGVGGTTTSYGVVSQAPSNGGASLLGNIEAYGGGAGGHWDYVEPNAGSPLVGSGGGSGDSTAGGAGTAGQGNSGGAGDGISTYGYQSGGGGGAGGVGQAYDHASGAGSGDGGVGLYIDWANALALGQGGYVGGGGGGGLHSEMANYDAGVGGLGGGGAGSEYVSTAANGVANTGGGGGGAGLPSNAQSTGGRGGSGLVVTRYLGGSVGSGGTQSSAIGGYTSNIFASDGTLSFNAIDVVLSGTVSGTGALSLDADGGTLSLSGTNTYTGNTTVAAGAVRVAGAGSLGAGRYAGNIVNSGSFEYASSVAQVLSGVISGVGTASKSTGSSTLTLSGTNTYSGTTTVSAGTLIVTNAAGLGSTASGTAVASGAVLDLQGVAVGGEALSLSGGTLSTSTGTSSLSGAVALGANSTVAVAGSALTLSGVVSGAGYGITKTGAGNLTLSGANTYSGTTTVSAGTLAVANAAGLGSAAAGTVVAIGAVLDLQGVAVGGEALSLNGGTLSTSTGTSSLSGAVALGADSTVAVDGSGLTLSGVVSGTGFGITKTSSGTLTLTGSNTYTGDTTISAGTLALASTGSLSASTDLLMSGSAIWDLQTAQSVSSLVMGAGNQITNSAGASALTVTGTATLANSVTTKGAQTFGGAVKLASDTTLNVTAADITFNDSVDSADASNPSSLTVNVTPGTTYYWVDWTTATSTSATGNITIGSNVVSVTYNNPNGFLGAQTSSGINYWTGNPSPYESASVANGPSTSDIIKLYRSGTQTITFSQPLENLAFAVVSLNGNGYAFDQDFSIVSSSATSAGYWGVGSLSRTVDGSAFKLNGVSGEPHGVIRFTGAFDSLSWESLSAENWNGFTVGVSGVSDAAGGVRFNGVVGAGATLGAVTIGGLLETSANVQAAASVSVAGITTLGGHVTTSGAQTYQSKTTLNGVNSTLTGVNISLADVTLGANTLTLTEGGAGAVSGTISGAGIVTKAGSGTVTLSGANSYAGGTTVSAGVLKAGVSSLGSVTSGAFGTSGVAVASGAALDVAGFTVANALSLAGTGVSGSGAVYNSTSTPGTLSGAMTLVGDTSIKGNAGALTISGAINGAHALDITTTNKTFTQSGVVGATSAPTGFTVNAGTGNVTLSATQTVAGPITVYGGNIFVNESLNTTGGGSAGDVLLKASGLANLSNNKSITTAGGDIVLWSNTENATSGTANNPVVLVGSNDLSTSGGKIIIAGGLDDKLADGTSGSDGIPDGYTYRSANDATWSAHLGASVNLDSAGGDIIIRGQGGGVGVGFAGGFTVDAGAGDLLLRGLSSSQDGVLLSTSAGTTGTLTTSSGNLTVIGLSDPDATGSTLARTGVRTSGGGTIEVVAGTGVVSMDGQGSRYGVALGVGSGSYAKDGTTTLIQSGGNAAAAITLSGTGGHGLTLRGASSKIHATGASGGITLSGTSSSWSSAVYSPLELLAVSGPISWLNSDATNGIYTANATITIGSKAGVNGLSSSASDVTVNVKKLEGSPTFAIGTTGAVTIQGVDGSDAFGQNFSTSQFGLNANGQTMGAFTFGSVGNTASLTFNTDVQASGPIAAHAGNLTLSAGTTLTAGAGSDIVLVASGDFINNAGASALAVSGGGRWIVYAGDTTGNTYGSLNSGNQGVFNKTYATLAPASVAAGNRYVIGNAGSQTITVTTTDATKFYGNTIDLSSNYTLTSSGVAGVSGVYLGVSATAGSVTSAYVFATTPTVTSTGAPVTQNVGTASITASGGVANTGYALSYSNTGTITITARPITVTATDKTKVYSDANPALTYTLIDNDGDSTLPNGDALGGSLTTSVTSTTGAGTWAGSITRGSLGATSTNYDISFIAGSFEVTPKALSVSGLTVADKVYDGTTTASISAAGNLVGKTAADNVSYVQTGAAFADKNTGVGKTVTVSGIGLTGADAVNYSIASTVTTTADITAKALTLSGFASANKVYDGLTTATISNAGSLVGVITGDTVAVSNAGASFANKNAATGKTVTLASVALGGTDGGNYSIASTATTTANITPKTITLSATKTYDGTTDLTGAVTLGGTVGSETLTYAGALAVSARVVGPDADPATVDNYVSALTLVDGTNGGEAANYQLPTLNAANAPLHITAAPLVVSLSNTGVTKVYDGTANAPSGFTPAFATSGLVAGDTLTYGFTDNAYNNASVVAANQITVSGLRIGGISSSNGSLVSDYTLSGVSSVSAAATITRAPLSVAANADAKFVTTADTAGFNGVTYNGFVNGETASDLAGTLAITRTNVSNDLAGSYLSVLVPSGLTSSNYELSFVNGNFTVVPADELLVRLSDASDNYGTATSYAINSIGYYNDIQNQVISLASTSSISASNGVSVADGAGGTASFTVGPLNPVYSSSGKLAVGGYNVGLSGLVTENSGNFSDTVTVIGSHQVNQKTISVNASGVTKTYDGTTSMDGVTIGLSGVETSDTVTVSGIGAFDVKSAAASAAYTLSNLEIAGADAHNYVLATGRTATGNGTINPYALTLGFTGVDKVYNGTTTASVTVTDNRIAGDVITLTPSATFANKNVGMNKAVTISGVTLGGVDRTNYSVSNSSGTASAAITQLASVTWTGNGGNLNWFDPANWDGAVPDLANVASVVIPSGVDVVFDTSAATGLAETSTVSLTSVGSLGSLTMTTGSLAIGSGGISLAGLTQGGGTLSSAGAVSLGSLAQTGGALAASGALTVTSGFTQGTSGTVTVGGNASITDTSGGTSVGNLAITGTLDISSTAGAITQASGTTITAGGATSVLAYDGNTSYYDVTLNGVANDFGAAVTVIADDVALADTNNLTLAATTTTGDLTVNTGAALSLSGNVTVGGNAALDAASAVVQTDGTLAVTGTTALEAGTNVSLSEVTNSFGGTVAVSGATDVDLVGTGGITLGAVATTGGLSVTAVTGNVGLSGVVSVASLSAVSTAGAITQSGGSVAVTTGTTNLTAATDITLSQSSNDFASTVNATGRDIDIEDANALTLGTVAATGSVAVLSTGNLALGGNVQGTLITAASSAGALTAGTLTATTGAIDLDAAGAVSLNGNVTSAAAVTVDSSAGAVSQTAGTTLTATGSVVVNAAADVSLAGAVSASLVDVDATGGFLSVNDLTATSGALTLDATGAVSVVGDLTAATTLGVTSSAGGVTQSTGSTMSGVGALTVSSRNNAVLAGAVTGASVTAASTAGALTVSRLNATAGAIDLDAAGAVRLNGNVTAANGLTVDTTSGGITQVGGNIAVAAGVTSLAATTDITLETTTNRFAGAVNANGANINLAAAGNLSIGAVSASGDAALSATNTLNLNGNITAQAVTGRSTAGDVNVGNVIANTTMTLEALRTVTMMGTIGVQSNLNVTAGRGVIQQPSGVLTVTTGPAVMSALYGNVELLNRASIPGLVIEDDRIRLARSGGVMSAIRDYIPVSQQTAVPAAPRVDNLTQSDLTAGRNVGESSGANPVVSTPVVSATSIGSTGKVFKLFSMDEARAMQLMPPTSEVAPGVSVANTDALLAPTPQAEVLGQTVQAEESGQAELDTASEANFTLPAFFGRGEIIVVEGGIATPAMAVVSQVISSPADLANQNSIGTVPAGASVILQDATGEGDK